MAQHSSGSSAPSREPPPLIGRQREWAVLQKSLFEGERANGHVVLLSGEPGIGKTRLAEELASEARRTGWKGKVAWGRCYYGTGAPAFWPWIQVLRSSLMHRDSSALKKLLGEDAAVIAQVLSELHQKLPEIAPFPPLESDAARFRTATTLDFRSQCLHYDNISPTMVNWLT